MIVQTNQKTENTDKSAKRRSENGGGSVTSGKVDIFI